MIVLKQGQKIKGYEQLMVNESGEYFETDLVNFCAVIEPGIPVNAFKASFVKDNLIG